jgi:lipopolysaccharide heptosyltransferase II
LSDNPWHAARKILCIRLDALGDVLMTTPALRALKEGRPDREIILLSSRSGAAVAGLIPEIDHAIVYDAPWVKASGQRSDSRPEYRMAARLRRAGFDAALIFTVFSQNPLPAAYLAYLANIPLRAAYCRENPYQLLTHWIPDPDRDSDMPMRHEVRRQLDLAASIGCTTPNESLSLEVPPAARRRLLNLLRSFVLNLQCPWVVIHPGSTAASRRYPPESFARAATSLALDHGFQVVFTGTGWEKGLVHNIQNAMSAPSLNLAGCLKLPEFAALLSLAPLLISNNTGPVHIAAALGTPVVDLYALTNPQHTPWGVPHRLLFHDVPCKYCYKSICPLGHQDCLRLVEPEEVALAAVHLLRETSGRPPGKALV